MVVRNVPDLGPAAKPGLEDLFRAERPAQLTTGYLGPGRGGFGDVLPPHPAAPGAPVTADPHQQRRRPPARRFVRERPRDRAAGDARRTLRTTPVIRINGTAFQHRQTRSETVPGSFQPNLIEPAARNHARRQEGSVGHDHRPGLSCPTVLAGADPGRVLNPRVDRFPLITVRSPSVRCRCGSSTARTGSSCRRHRVRIFSCRTLRATHARTVARGGQCAEPCHSFAILECKPRGLPGSIVLMQTRQSGVFRAGRCGTEHQCGSAPIAIPAQKKMS